MASKVIERLKDTAEKLYQIRRLISEKEENNKRELDALKTERDAIQAVLLADLKNNEIDNIKTSSGDSFYRGKSNELEIVNELGAFKWALENKAISLNKTIAKQILKEMKEIPPCFEMVEREFISVRKAKATKNNEEI